MPDELDKPSSSKQSTPEQAAAFLQAEISKVNARNTVLEEDMKALIAEYRAANDEEAPEKLKKQIRGYVPRAIEILYDLLEGSNSDGIRSSIAKYIIDRGLQPDQLGGIDKEMDKLTKLLEEIKSE